MMCDLCNMLFDSVCWNFVKDFCVCVRQLEAGSLALSHQESPSPPPQSGPHSAPCFPLRSLPSTASSPTVLLLPHSDLCPLPPHPLSVLCCIAPSPLLQPTHSITSPKHLVRLHWFVPSSISLSDFCHPTSQRVWYFFHSLKYYLLQLHIQLCVMVRCRLTFYLPYHIYLRASHL